MRYLHFDFALRNTDEISQWRVFALRIAGFPIGKPQQQYRNNTRDGISLLLPLALMHTTLTEDTMEYRNKRMKLKDSRVRVICRRDSGDLKPREECRQARGLTACWTCQGDLDVWNAS